MESTYIPTHISKAPGEMQFTLSCFREWQKNSSGFQNTSSSFNLDRRTRSGLAELLWEELSVPLNQQNSLEEEVVEECLKQVMLSTANLGAQNI